MLTFDAIAPGCTLWLINPFKEFDPEDSDDERKNQPETYGIERRVFGHPAMVLHTARSVAGTTDIAVYLFCSPPLSS